MLKVINYFIFILLIAACSRKPENTQISQNNKKTTSEVILKERRFFSLLVYNVQNLFDTKHDEGKDDWTFLSSKFPQKKLECEKVKNKFYQKECFNTDWTDEKLDLKIKQIKKVFDSIGRPVDLFGLVEVENHNVVERLAKAIGMKSVIVTDSPDKRGVDVALIYNESSSLKKIAHREHRLSGPLFEKKPTRNILEVQFQVANKHNVFVFINHWPSQSNPSEARMFAAETIIKRTQEILRDDPHAYLVVSGDFNTINGETPHALNDGLFKDKLYLDVNVLLNEGEDLTHGTYFYFKGKKWNQLDRMLVNRKFYDLKLMEVDLNSFRIHAPSFLKDTKRIGDEFFRIPKQYNFQTLDEKEAGFSDHFPIYVEFLF